jgi:hypothetical protein
MPTSGNIAQQRRTRKIDGQRVHTKSVQTGTPSVDCGSFKRRMFHSGILVKYFN